MKKATISTYNNRSGQYLTSDRSGKTNYPVSFKANEDGKNYWTSIEEIKSVMFGTMKMTGQEFATKLQIPSPVS